MLSIGSSLGVTAGRIGSVIVHGQPVLWPARVGVLPPLADQRLNRPADHELAYALARGGQSMVRCQILSGLGGVGKTQIAAGLAHRLWDSRQVDLLVWITAASRTAIMTGFAAAFSRITGTNVSDAATAAARFLAWLAEPHQRQWLIVLDNLDSPEDLNGLWPPTCAWGRTVVSALK